MFDDIIVLGNMQIVLTVIVKEASVYRVFLALGSIFMHCSASMKTLTSI